MEYLDKVLGVKVTYEDVEVKHTKNQNCVWDVRRFILLTD